MQQEKRLPIGSQNFEDLRKNGFFYVDKTEYIFNLIKDSKYFFLSRPRRFGKSLFLSTLAAYFEGKKELFQGLYLEHAEEELARQQGREAWVKHPVFLIDFSQGQYTTPEGLYSRANTMLTRFEAQYHVTLLKGSEEAYGDRMTRILQAAYEQTGQQAVVLVDEYDKPLLETLYGGKAELFDHHRDALAAFFSVLKGCDAYLRFGMLSGVTRFSRVSIFSSINNLMNISMDDAFAGICGFARSELEKDFLPEIEALASAQELSVADTFTKLAKLYDGYCFSKKGVSIYNSFSLLNVLQSKDFGYYWFTGSTGNYLVNLLREAELDIPSLDGGIEYGALELESYKAVKEDAVPILFQSGYLSIKEYITEDNTYRLGFPNDEVRYAFLQILFPRVFRVRGSVQALTAKFKNAVAAGRVDDFMGQLKALIAGCPYGKGVEATEDHYQTAVYLVFKLMGEWVRTEIHSALGRADCIVETNTTVYLFEFKLLSAGSPAEAIAQIRRQGYAAPYLTGAKKVVLIGASFDEAARTLGEWQVEEA